MPVNAADFKQAVKKDSKFIQKVISTIDREVGSPDIAPLTWANIISQTTEFEWRGFNTQEQKEPYCIIQVSFLIRDNDNKILLSKRNKPNEQLENFNYRISDGVSPLFSFSPQKNILLELNKWLKNNFYSNQSELRYRYSYKGIVLNRVPSKVIDNRFINPEIKHQPWYIMFILEIKLESEITLFNRKNMDTMFTDESFDTQDNYDKYIDSLKLYADRAVLKGLKYQSTFSDGSAKFIYNNNTEWDSSLPKDDNFQTASMNKDLYNEMEKDAKEIIQANVDTPEAIEKKLGTFVRYLKQIDKLEGIFERIYDIIRHLSKPIDS